MKQNILLSSAAIAALAAFSPVLAQDPLVSIPVPILQFKTAPVRGRTVTGAPYSADVTTQTTQSLPDGNRIERTTSMKLYRDSQGRERQEEGGTRPTILISDPVAKTSYTLNPEAHTARKSAGTLQIAKDTARTAELQTLELQLRDLVAAQSRAASASPAAPAAVPPSPPPARPAPVTEQLSPKSMEGVFATGTRTTNTIPAGEVGNLQPIDVVDEVWYSPDLQMNILTTHSDPRTGEVTYRLSNINRNEPDPSLFQVPADYKIVEPGAGGRGGAITFKP